MNENLIDWPSEFCDDDSQSWRNIKDYTKRMEMIAFSARSNFSIIQPVFGE